jgi:hypothetical protein
MTVAVPLVLAAWGLLCAWAACRLCEPLRGPAMRREWQLLLFMALLPLAVLDEMMAKPGFDAACAETARITQYAPLAAGRKWLATHDATEKLAGFGLPVNLHRHAWHDPATGQAVIRLVHLEAGGGRLARLIGRPGEPLTFSAACFPPGWSQLQPRLLLPSRP